MKRVHIALLAALLGVAIGAFGMVAGNAQAPGSRSEEEAIKAVIVAMTEAFNRHDAKAWTRIATTDAQLVTVRGESMNGVAEIEKGLTTLFQSRNRNAHGRAEALRYRNHGRAEIRVRRKPDTTY